MTGRQPVTGRVERGAGTAAPLRGQVRALRVGVLGGTSLLLACGAHVVGGGRLPSAVILAATAVLLGLLATLVTARRCRWPVLLLVLGLEQVALHSLFTAAATPVVGCLPAAHQHLGAVVAGCDLPMTAMADPMAAAGPGASLAMLVGHALAVVATAWVLARGESWLWELAARVARSAVVATSPLPAAVRLRPPVPRRFALVTVPGRLGAPRGPPVPAH